MNEERRFAVLVDAENVSAKYIKIIFDEMTNYGVITYRRIYGDWTSTRNNGWKGILLDHSITPIQQYSYTDGKNASDSAMIIDAMDILYTMSVDGFCIVSSDSDFTRLASRLRESGMTVIGMGESKTPSAFIAACSAFKYLDILFERALAEESGAETRETESRSSRSRGTSSRRTARAKESGEAEKKAPRKEPAASPAPQPQTKKSTIRRALKTIIMENSDEDNRISLANLGNQLAKRFSDFDVRNYGHKKLTTFVESLGDFEIERLTLPGDGKVQQIFVRIKENASADL